MTYLKSVDIGKSYKTYENMFLGTMLSIFITRKNCVQHCKNLYSTRDSKPDVLKNKTNTSSIQISTV